MTDTFSEIVILAKYDTNAIMKVLDSLSIGRAEFELDWDDVSLLLGVDCKELWDWVMVYACYRDELTLPAPARVVAQWYRFGTSLERYLDLDYDLSVELITILRESSDKNFRKIDGSLMIFGNAIRLGYSTAVRAMTDRCTDLNRFDCLLESLIDIPHGLAPDNRAMLASDAQYILDAIGSDLTSNHCVILVEYPHCTDNGKRIIRELCQEDHLRIRAGHIFSRYRLDFGPRYPLIELDHSIAGPYRDLDPAIHTQLHQSRRNLRVAKPVANVLREHHPKIWYPIVEFQTDLWFIYQIGEDDDRGAVIQVAHDLGEWLPAEILELVATINAKTKRYKRPCSSYPQSITEELD